MARKSRCENMRFKIHYVSSENINDEIMAAVNHGHKTMVRIIAESILRQERDNMIGSMKDNQLVIRG
ncbi:MAG: hypothetical protein A4E53_00176 [Pelotomaculum sp. PtaB.Bin104]|nr:MAG: hypothetical protein A4E53_00176 [Pelotomaculum sp. PtaB.Bin104]OPY60721.1 MAG: hypothetical protein A4E56_02524 [Pelotomaculum sp. PtaU1.Bin065]